MALSTGLKNEKLYSAGKAADPEKPISNYRYANKNSPDIDGVIQAPFSKSRRLTSSGPANVPPVQIATNQFLSID